MNKLEISKLLITIGAIYQNKFKYPTGESELDEATVNAWMLFLGDIDYDIASKATVKLMHSDPLWPPTAPQIIEELRYKDHLTPIEAWKVAVRYVCGYVKKEEIAPEIARTTDAIGKNVIGNTTDSTVSYVMNLFVKSYQEILDHDENKELRALSGLPQSGMIGDILDKKLLKEANDGV